MENPFHHFSRLADERLCSLCLAQVKVTSGVLNELSGSIFNDVITLQSRASKRSSIGLCMFSNPINLFSTRCTGLLFLPLLSRGYSPLSRALQSPWPFCQIKIKLKFCYHLKQHKKLCTNSKKIDPFKAKKSYGGSKVGFGTFFFEVKKCENRL